MTDTSGFIPTGDALTTQTTINSAILFSPPVLNVGAAIAACSDRISQVNNWNLDDVKSVGEALKHRNLGFFLG